MTEKILRESVAEAPVKRGSRWRVIVARPGQGSSGYYSEDLFRRDAAKIIAPGGQAFIGHDSERSVKDLIGVYPDGAYWSEEDKAVVSELEVFSHWREFVEEVGPHVGMSLYALGEQDDEGNVTAIHEDSYNGCDLVARPGLVGSGIAEKLYESARSRDLNTPGVNSAQERKEIKMDEETKAEFKALHDLIAPLVAKDKAEKAEAAQVEADKDAGRKAVEAYNAQVVAIDAADLPEKVVESLRKQAMEGVDVTDRIADAVAIKEAADEAATNRITEGAPGREFGARKVESATDLGKVFG